MRARRHGVRRRRRGRNGRDDADTVLPVQRRADRPQRRGAARLLPQYHPATRVFYASKACSNLWFLDRVRRAGIDIEVNSGGELWKARSAGFEPRQIIFNGVAKTRAEVAAALEGPIEALVVDSVFELRRIADVAADLRKQARVALRVDLNVASETHPGLRTSKGAKAGIDVNEALGAFGLAAQLPNIELVGMHYHIGSQITRVDPYIEALEAALALLTRIETAHDIRLEHLNIGGGFAIPYYDRTGDEPDTYFEAPHTLEGYATRDRRARGGGAPGPPALSGAGARHRRQQRHPREPRGGREDEARRGRPRVASHAKTG